MALKLSEGQKLAIDTKDKNILVSAAAGSGKTFVLTQRVLSRIINDKWNIDSFLIVTFTRDAAAEMKDRITKSIESKLNDVDNNELRQHLEKQLVLINKANISTIDSFCANVIRQNFHKIDLDLGYRNITQNEAITLKKQAIDNVFEKLLAEKNADFDKFYNMFCDKNRDDNVEKMIYKLFEYADNSPYPNKWLDQCTEKYESADSFYDSIWYKANIKKVNDAINNAKIYINKAVEILRDFDKPSVIEKVYLAIQDFENALKLGGLEELRKQKLSFQLRYPKNFDGLYNEKVALMKRYVFFSKKELNNALSYASMSKEKVEILYKNIKPIVIQLVKTTKLFTQEYKQLKLENQLADFNDISHYCLNILRDSNGTTTDIAREYQNKYKEIIIDEYQDSNYLQEDILTAVSSIEQGRNNIFMVGDVKQAIYKFRLTTPKIFMDKYNSYVGDNDKEQLILLSENYRSRAVVLDACNIIFKQIMDVNLGNVNYTDDVALNPKANFPQPDSNINISTNTELLIADTCNQKEVNYKFDAKTGEAKIVAKRIYDMLYTKPLYIYDKDNENYRPVKKSDIVILVRKRTNAEVFYNELNSAGISCIFEKSNPLYKTTEVKNIISLLKVIDNPIDDIEIINLLHSPIYALTFDEITTLRLNNRQMPFYNSVKEYAKSDNKIADILNKFLNDINYYRDYAINNSITDLITEIYEKSNYFYYVGISSENGQDNLRLFKEKAMEFESLNHNDLHSFINNINIDLSDDVEDKDMVSTVSTLSENDDVVRIMTIHKSKGLEFPVVFVSQLHEKIDNGYKENFIYDRELGIGLKYIDQTERIRYKTPPFDTILEKYTADENSETLRLLYVALTRAREKLIITGVANSKIPTTKDNKMEILYDLCEESETLFPIAFRNMADSPLFWIISAIKRKDFDVNNIFKEKWIPVEDIDSLESINAEKNIDTISNLNNIEKIAGKGEYANLIRSKLSYKYPYNTDVNLPSKISITEIKRKMQNDDSEPYYIQNIDIKPQVVKSNTNISATQKGILYHTVMENIEFNYNENSNELINSLLNRKILTLEEAKVISTKKIDLFLNSQLYTRVKSADYVFKEAPFVMSIKASRLKEYANSNENLVVHGIIDLYFVENNEIVLVDYKTDKIFGNLSALAKKYKIQLDLYKEALEESTSKKVKECIIYSIDKGVAINV